MTVGRWTRQDSARIRALAEDECAALVFAKAAIKRRTPPPSRLGPVGNHARPGANKDSRELSRPTDVIFRPNEERPQPSATLLLSASCESQKRRGPVCSSVCLDRRLRAGRPLRNGVPGSTEFSKAARQKSTARDRSTPHRSRPYAGCGRLEASTRQLRHNHISHLPAILSVVQLNGSASCDEGVAAGGWENSALARFVSRTSRLAKYLPPGGSSRLAGRLDDCCARCRQDGTEHSTTLPPR